MAELSADVVRAGVAEPAADATAQSMWTGVSFMKPSTLRLAVVGTSRSSLVHFTANGIEITQRREQVQAGVEERTTELSSLLVARFASDVTVRGQEQMRLQVVPEKINLFDATTGVALL